MARGGNTHGGKGLDAEPAGKLSGGRAADRRSLLPEAFHDNRKEGEFDFATHHDIARELEEECIVLLKNDNILPLQKLWRENYHLLP